ncbi:GNAT family N-acetyltransferase [Antarcticibacterium flavum]|uniref:GNAT family N-acetyltransferase n=1 Tax=Antarcticibacterium flavum TaxID=2058175 RepID=A0A5B7X3Q1_9FLAO|nr:MULTISPECIES: GNAT family N-acetyltransferase [Antarcticibacterium]MCM4161149.1 GNAT family N-acetyltransferase [Antarcticibacterium sp. W02-3]QCY69352.1 GNAT family N-acetyltransferase [Antarcticibacterium flavum]
MEINIRKSEKKDAPSILELIKELAHFEKETEAVEVDVEELEREGFGDHPLFTCFVAEVNGNIEGIALVYFRFSTWKGRTVHLEDLIVREKMRGTGIGSALYRKVIEYSLEQGCKRTEWVVLDWNQPAIDFYKRSGATVFENWNTVQMDEQAMKEFISQG